MTDSQAYHARIDSPIKDGCPRADPIFVQTHLIGSLQACSTAANERPGLDRPEVTGLVEGAHDDFDGLPEFGGRCDIERGERAGRPDERDLIGAHFEMRPPVEWVDVAFVDEPEPLEHSSGGEGGCAHGPGGVGDFRIHDGEVEGILGHEAGDEFLAGLAESVDLGECPRNEVPGEFLEEGAVAVVVDCAEHFGDDLIGKPPPVQTDEVESDETEQSTEPLPVTTKGMIQDQSADFGRAALIGGERGDLMLPFEFQAFGAPTALPEEEADARMVWATHPGDDLRCPDDAAALGILEDEEEKIGLSGERLNARGPG